MQRAIAETGEAFVIRIANAQDGPRIRLMLEQAQLPVEDVADSRIDFLVAEQDGQLIGVIGLQVFGTAALLRSLVVAPAIRGSGVGHALVAAVEARARQQRVAQLVLLTQTAEAFFERNGYASQTRASVPGAIRDTAEFKSLCPASAVCLSKALSS
jgi:amino-acid N-acetyltransferase